MWQRTYPLSNSKCPTTKAVEHQKDSTERILAASTSGNSARLWVFRKTRGKSSHQSVQTLESPQDQKKFEAAEKRLDEVIRLRMVCHPDLFAFDGKYYSAHATRITYLTGMSKLRFTQCRNNHCQLMTKPYTSFHMNRLSSQNRHKEYPHWHVNVTTSTV